MNKIIIVLLFISIWNPIVAQKYDYVWITGYSSATVPDTSNFGTTFLDFNYKPAKVIRKWIAMSYDKAGTTICNDIGNVLFSTNGIKVIGKDFKPVRNGDTMLYNNKFKYGLRSEQGLLALPMPNNNKQFVIIYGYRYVFETYPIYYSIFDQSKGSNGELIKKNQIVVKDSVSAGKFTAVKHANGRDWWVHISKQDENHYWLLLDPNGIKINHKQKIKNKSFDGVGQAVFSPDGNFYVECNSESNVTGQDIDVYNFDRCKGLLFNPKKIHFDTSNFIGCAISPNSKYLYFSNGWKILQYDLTASNIKDTEITVAVWDGFIDYSAAVFYQMQLAPDGKIYVITTGANRYMHTIENPDEKGIACNVKQHSIKLFTYNLESIPNHPNYRLGALKGSPCDTLKSVATQEIDNQELVQIYPNPANDILNISVVNNSPATLIIKDISGRVIEKATFTAQTTISTVNYFNGMIFCEIWQDNQRISTERIVIQH